MGTTEHSVDRAGSSSPRPTTADDRDPIAQARVAVIVSTIGRPDLLDRLMASISEQTLLPSEVIVVDQSSDRRTRAVVDKWRARIPVRRLSSIRGVSLGLNVGIAALGDYDFLNIACDDTRYAPDALTRAAETFSVDDSVGVVSGRLLGVPGRPAQLRSFGHRSMLLDHRSVWTNAIEATCFYRADFIRDVGAFDEELGPGAASPWQSGEGTDMLLRGLKAGWPIAYNPQIIVYEDNPHDTGPEDRACRVKARRSARGTGRVFRRHHGLPLQARILIRPLGAVLLSAACNRWALAGWHLQRFIGRMEGLTGRVLPGPRQRIAQNADRCTTSPD